MNCRRISELLAAGLPLPEDAGEHLRQCPICSRLAAVGEPAPERALDPAAERRVIAALTTDLSPVRPLAAPGWYVLAAVAAAALVATLGIRLLGVAGWAADSLLERTWFTASLAGGLVLTALTVSRQMAPGALLRLAPRAIVLLATLSLAAGALLYPVKHYAGFPRAVAACLSIGLAHAAAAGALVFWIVRRGAFLSRSSAAAAIALLGGLAGAVVLFVFCPHRDLGHIALAHATVPPAAAALAAWIARR